MTKSNIEVNLKQIFTLKIGNNQVKCYWCYHHESTLMAKRFRPSTAEQQVWGLNPRDLRSHFAFLGKTLDTNYPHFIQVKSKMRTRIHWWGVRLLRDLSREWSNISAHSFGLMPQKPEEIISSKGLQDLKKLSLIRSQLWRQHREKNHYDKREKKDKSCDKNVNFKNRLNQIFRSRLF